MVPILFCLFFGNIFCRFLLSWYNMFICNCYLKSEVQKITWSSILSCEKCFFFFFLEICWEYFRPVKRELPYYFAWKIGGFLHYTSLCKKGEFHICPSETSKLRTPRKFIISYLPLYDWVSFLAYPTCLGLKAWLLFLLFVQIYNFLPFSIRTHFKFIKYPFYLLLKK